MEENQLIIEEFKDIEGYENYYQISNCGRVKSVERKVFRKNGTLYSQKEQYIKLTINKNGYYYVTLRKNNKIKTFLVHRIVAKAFIPNPNKLPQVNHINENKLDNKICNLEWCDNLYNENYGTGKTRAGLLHRKAVIQYDKDNNFIYKFNSGIDAERETNIDNASISRCCYGKQHKAGGYYWRFANE